MKAEVVVAGVAVADEIYFLPGPLVPGEKHRASSILRVVGGNGAIAALAIARLGGQVHLLTRTGDDGPGDGIRAALGAEGVDFGLSMPISAHKTSTSTIVIEPGGERTIVNYFDRDFPDRPDWLPRTLPKGARVVMGDVRWETGTRHVFELARQSGGIAVFDGDRRPADPELIALATHRVFSAQGLREITGQDDLGAALKTVAGGQGGYFAATDGARGVISLEGGKAVHYQALAVDAVDTLGAGDVWHGAFALALAEGAPIPAAIRFASVSAALKCRARGGGMAAPRRQDVEQALRGIT